MDTSQAFADSILLKRHHPRPCRCFTQQRLLIRAASSNGSGPTTNSDGLSDKLQRVRQRLGLPTEGSVNVSPPPKNSSDVGVGEWGAQSWYEDWDPSVRFSVRQVERIADEGIAKFRKETRNSGPRDKWITPVRIPLSDISPILPPTHWPVLFICRFSSLAIFSLVLFLTIKPVG